MMAPCQTAVRIPPAVQTPAGASHHCTANDLAKGRRAEESGGEGDYFRTLPKNISQIMTGMSAWGSVQFY